MRTSKEIQTDLLALLVDSPLAQAISGKVYRGGQRPRDSKNEDITLHITSVTASQRQEGVAVVNVFVPDIPVGMTATLTEDARRTAELERIATNWAEGLTTNLTGEYLIRLASAVYTMHEKETKEHFVVVRLRFSIINPDNQL
jgi:hypothetical protein|nr:MAG TPA: hypothetical protein [Caudoviricetes sp.]